MSACLDFAKVGIEFAAKYLLFWNLLFAIVIVFFERRNPKSVWAWLLLLFFIPVLGFVFYLMLGQDLRKRKRFKMKEMEDRFGEAVRLQEQKLLGERLQENEEIVGYKDMILYNLTEAQTILTNGNDIDFITDGNAKFETLIKDIRGAKKFIHLEYYIIRNDVVFAAIVEALQEKVKEGVEVRILYDAMGCRTVSRAFWKKLNRMGIETTEFFPAVFKRLQLRINYRNHRKIVVIDNQVAYVGGFNIGREYVGLDGRFGHWRDTHMRLQGPGVLGLELRFVQDWSYAAKENLLEREMLFEGSLVGNRDNCQMQVISSGPDQTRELIRDNYLRLIAKAKKSIYIQTPYFIPDEAIFTALKIAVGSGIEVNIMIPCMPDHLFVYWATYSYVGELVLAGAHCYVYQNGFLHCKGMMVDGEAFCYGTANMDIRSFALNFEVNIVVYHRRKARELEQIFQKDMENCERLTREIYEKRSLRIRFKEQICRLLSPLL